MVANSFARRLDEALKAAGMSKLGFSNQLQDRRSLRNALGEPPLRKVDRPALYTFLDGRGVPPLDTAQEMAKILGVRLGWLAIGEEPVEPGLSGPSPPIWLMDGQKGPWRRPSLGARRKARRVFEEEFLSRSSGFRQADPIVQVVFKELLARRLARRRALGERSVSEPSYRAQTAWGLYLKCFLDVMAGLPEGTRFSSPDFTDAFLARVGGWLDDEKV
jgi:hypothetical protein